MNQPNGLSLPDLIHQIQGIRFDLPVHPLRNKLLQLNPSTAEEAIPVLIEVLQGDDGSARGGTAKILAQLSFLPADAVPALAANLTDYWSGEAVVRALGAIGPAAVPVLIEALRNEQSRGPALHAFAALCRFRLSRMLGFRSLCLSPPLSLSVGLLRAPVAILGGAMH
jgi:hypothetical protein